MLDGPRTVDSAPPLSIARAGSDSEALAVRSLLRSFGSVKRRATLHRSPLIRVDDCYIPPEGPFPAGYEDKFQIALPYHGLFTYAVGQRKWMFDANQALFISPGWEASEEHPVADLGHAAILLDPSADLLAELAAPGSNGSRAFQKGSVPITMRLHLLVQHILRLPHDCLDPLHVDEWVIEATREATRSTFEPKTRDSKMIGRAKELLHARSDERLSLQAIAAELGVSPVYLTQEFTRHEGTPLYRYQLRLRLVQALLELPHCDDITGLALDLGFSSHSHFTAVFRGAFAITPTEYRSKIGTRSLGLMKPLPC